MIENRKIKRGEIYWIAPNPYRETVGSVQMPGRPGIVVSNDANNLSALTFEIVYLTTAPKKDLPTHCEIRSTNRISTALCEQITTISAEQVGDYIGECTTEEMSSVDACMAISLGIDLAKEAAPEPTQASSANDELRIKAMIKEIGDLRVALTRAERGEELMRELYAQLLDRYAT